MTEPTTRSRHARLLNQGQRTETLASTHGCGHSRFPSRVLGSGSSVLGQRGYRRGRARWAPSREAVVVTKRPCVRLVGIAAPAAGLVLVLPGRVGRRHQRVQRAPVGSSGVRRRRLGLLGLAERRGYDRLDLLRSDPAARCHRVDATGRSQRGQQGQRQKARKSNAPDRQVPISSRQRLLLGPARVEKFPGRPRPV
jgi:hypothetical protein